jgi:hypothetical protein
MTTLCSRSGINPTRASLAAILTDFAALQHSLKDGDVTTGSGGDQRGIEVFSTRANQEFDSIRLASIDGRTERRLIPDAVSGVHVRPALDQQFDDFELSLADGDQQCRDTDLVLRVCVGALVEQRLGRPEITGPNGPPQGFPGIVAVSPTGERHECEYCGWNDDLTKSQHLSDAAIGG